MTTTDYKPIASLLDKYRNCATSVEEERQLRIFFTLGPIPPPLQPYKNWFLSSRAEEIPPLGDAFDRRILLYIKEDKKRKRRTHITYLFRVALFILIAVLLLCVCSSF